MKKRLTYLDLIKTVSIFMVCTYHITVFSNIDLVDQNNFINILMRLLYNIMVIGVPLFFMVNGALLLNSELNLKKHLKKTGVIFIQFWIWRIITLLFFAYDKFNVIGFKNIFNYIFFKDLPEIPTNHFWFMSTLIGIYLIFPFIKVGYDYFNKKTEYTRCLINLLCITLIVCFIPSVFSTLTNAVPIFRGMEIWNINIFIPFDNLFTMMLFYFVFGGLIQKNKEKVMKIRRTILCLSLIFGVLLIYSKWYVEAGVGFYDPIFQGYTTLACMMIALPIFIMSTNVENKVTAKWFTSFINVIGSNTMFVYYAHWIIGKLVLKQLFVGNDFVRSVVNITAPSILIITLSIIAKYAKKIPFINKIFI